MLITFWLSFYINLHLFLYLAPLKKTELFFIYQKFLLRLLCQSSSPINNVCDWWWHFPKLFVRVFGMKWKRKPFFGCFLAWCYQKVMYDRKIRWNSRKCFDSHQIFIIHITENTEEETKERFSSVNSEINQLYFNLNLIKKGASHKTHKPFLTGHDVMLDWFYERNFCIFLETCFIYRSCVTWNVIESLWDEMEKKRVVFRYGEY